MEKTILIFSKFTFILALSMVGSVAWAALITDSGFPPPGDVSYTVTGEAHLAGGAIVTYTELNPDAYGDLYFSLWQPPRISTFHTSSRSIETYQPLGPLNARWYSSQTFPIYDASLNFWRHYQPTFDLTVISGASPRFAPGSNGISTSVGPSWAITGTSFSVRYEFKLGGVAAGPLFDSIHTTQNDYLRTDVYGKFWWNEAAVVPVPAAVWLFGSGLLGLVGVARRKKV